MSVLAFFCLLLSLQKIDQHLLGVLYHVKMAKSILFLFVRLHLSNTYAKVSPMSTNVAVDKTGTENNVALIRRFTRRVQESGIVKRVRGIRYAERVRSHYVKKKKALEVISRRAIRENLLKLGKISATPERRKK